MYTLQEGSEMDNGVEHEPRPDSECNKELDAEIHQEAEKKEAEPKQEQELEAVSQSGTATMPGADPKNEGPIEFKIGSDEAGTPPPTEGNDSGELQKDGDVDRAFTMRELSSELKTEENEVNSPNSQESPSHYTEQNNAALELIDSVTGIDEEGRSRQRILTYAARRYASAIARNPGDYDALYNWALVLQESADNVSSDSVSPSKDALLEEACRKYEEATHLCPTLHDRPLMGKRKHLDKEGNGIGQENNSPKTLGCGTKVFGKLAFYNWAIAISDRAKMRGRTKEAEEFWRQATNNYEKAVQLNWNSPQALNNWGLALQELSAIVPAREKQTIVKTAISKFRAAIELQFDFHRAIYNLGTVLYGLAEDTLRTGGSGNAKDISSDELYGQSAIYIAAAHALKPSYSVYSSALRLVRSMLPLPYLKVGYLTAPPLGSLVAPHSDWKRCQFVLNHESLQQLNTAEPKQLPRSLSGKGEIGRSQDRKAFRVNIPDIVSVSACSDLTLPPGAGLCIDTIHGAIYLIADSWESLDGWLDAIRLVYTIYARGKSDVLAGVVTG